MKPRPASPPTKRARALRREQTRAEALLRSHLRGRQLEGRKFHRQFPISPFVVDFVCWNERLVIEIDGGQHDASEDREADRTRWLRAQGFSVLRFWNNEVLDNSSGVLAAIAGAFGALRPHPAPLPRGEGEDVATQDPSPGGRGSPEDPHPDPLPRGEGGAKRG